MPQLDLVARPEAVPLARTWAREVLVDLDASALRDDVDLVLSELLANAVLHAPGPARVVLERVAEGVRLEVRDGSTTAPLRRESTSGATTGRGLNLVAALSQGWGVQDRPDHEHGKSVWCVLTGDADEQVPDLDVDALLEAFSDDDVPGRPRQDPRVEVRVGEAPVELLRAAKDHLDGLLREIALAEGAGGLPREVVEPMAEAVRRFADARGQLRALITAAAGRGERRVDIVFRLPVSLADVGEEYLQALSAADAFARDRRMLSLESPVEHRVLREWYVGRLVAGLRAAGGLGPDVPEETFEARLLRELHRLQQGQRAAERSAQLQRATAGLAAAESVEDIARIATAEGVRMLGASGGALTRASSAGTVAVHEVGRDVGVDARYRTARGSGLPPGPSSLALRTGETVLVESREDRDARFPGLARVQPDVVAVAALPLLIAGEVVGALRFSWDEPHVFSADDRALLDGLAVQTGQAVARAQALRRLRAVRDELDRLLQTDGHVSGTDLGVLRTLYGEAPVGIAVYDAQGRYLRVNEVIASVNGRSAADHVGRAVRDIVVGTPQEAERLHELVRTVFETGRTLEEEVTTARHTTSWRTSWFPVRDAEGQVEAAVVLAVEITDQRRAEARTRLLATLGDRLGRARSQGAVLEAVADLLLPDLADWVSVHLQDREGAVRCFLVRHADPALQPALDRLAVSFTVRLDQPHGAGKVLATGRSEVLAVVDDQVLEALAGPDRTFAAAMREVGAGAGAVVPLVAGETVLGALSVSRRATAALPPEDLAVLEDVGRRAGVALQGVAAVSTSVRLEMALDAADVGSFDWHVRTGHLDWDDRLFRLLDVDQTTFDGSLQTFFGQLHPDDAEVMREAMTRSVLEVGELAATYRVLLHDGGLRWLEARGRALPGADGATERLVGVVVDVTERQLGQQRAERTLELMGDAFFLLDDRWCFRYLNREAERLLARDRSQLLGRSVWEVFPDAVGTAFEQQYERAVRDGVPVRFEQWFPALDRLFEVRAHPGPDGLAVYFVDAGVRRATERERDRALARLALIDAVGVALTEVLDVDQALTRLAGLLVPGFADLCTIDLADGGVQSARSVVTTAADPAKAEAMLKAEAVLPRRRNPGSGVHQVLAGAPLVHLAVTDEHLAKIASDSTQADLWVQIQMRHACVVPLAARGRVFGAISLLRTGDQALPFLEEDLALLQDVGRRAGLLVDNVAQYTAQRQVAEDLQHSLLPELPAVAGLQLGAAYQPSSSASLVGGDWYDAFVLPDGSTGLVVGDVMGHDMAAAAAMGQLRSVLRTCAADGDSPARVLGRLDRLVSSFAMADLATVVYAQLARRADGGAVLTWSNAGHPSPLLLAPDGSARYLDGGRGVMIGTGVDAPRDQAVEQVDAGSTVLMFTDGLVERRGRDMDDMLEELSHTAVRLLGEVGSPDELCARLLATVRRDGGTDDAAVVALRLLPGES
ncbi:MAG: domain S-box-containing protein [Frankiales bacterium]|nr:domain S-box-containing protein [Frankiales bacterium]